MSDNHPLFSVIGLSAAFGIAVFSTVQYIQVKPLEIDLTKANQALLESKKLIKSSSEYQKLQKLYFTELAKVEYLAKELDSKAEIESKYNLSSLELANSRKQLLKLEKYSDYENLLAKLRKSEKIIEKYVKSNKKSSNEISRLKNLVSLKNELKELKIEKRHIETILDCMFEGCKKEGYRKYSVSDGGSIAHFKSILATINKKIDIIISEMSKT